jgi:predicted ferric reductase
MIISALILSILSIIMVIFAVIETAIWIVFFLILLIIWTVCLELPYKLFRIIGKILINNKWRSEK